MCCARPSPCAVGGIFPGRLHSRGKLHEWHKVQYSIGVAGTYLLHVRLRKQAAALPGSPFTLHVTPGAAFALTSELPSSILHGEVGQPCNAVLATADKMGNVCDAGGGQVTCSCPTEEVSAACVDMGDGSYELSWRCTTIGTYQGHIKIDGKHIVNSPVALHFVSTLPKISHSQLSGDGLRNAVVGEEATVVVKLIDQFQNPTVLT